MKLRLIHIFLLLFLIITMPYEAHAHPGRTDSNGCHYCRTNCAKWGLSNGEYHCHGGGGISAGSSNSSSSNNSYNPPVPQEVPKSSDNTLKSVIVDGTVIVVADQMEYKTNKDKVTILVETNDDKAKSTINNRMLVIGENNINITVKAEDGSEKNYNLTIKRLSNNTNIEITIDDEKINFVNNKARILVSSDTTQLNYKYETEDESTNVEITGDTNLKYGDNIVQFKVTAEDGTEKVYELTVDRQTQVGEVVSGIIGIGLIGGIGYGIYYVIKKKKNKEKV